MDELPGADDDQPGLFGPMPRDAGEEPTQAAWDPSDDGDPVGGPDGPFGPALANPFDELIDAGWEPGEDADPAGHDDADDEQSWLAGMPDEVRADYLAGPYTGAGEVIPPGFTHREPGGPSGVGFAAGGALDGLAPGPWLALALAAVVAAGHDGLGESELIGVLLGWQRLAAWSQAGMAGAVGALAARRRDQAGRPGWARLGEHVADELAVALRLTSRSASRLLDVAAGLGRLTEVAAALDAGMIDWAKACLFVDELAVLGDEQAAAAAARLLARASEQTTGQLRAALARAVLAADPEAAQRRRAEGRKDARLEIWHEPSGNAAIAGRELPPAQAVAADAALTADAQWLRENGTVGTLAELRAAAFIARLSGQDLSSVVGTVGGITHGSAADPRLFEGMAAAGGIGDNHSGADTPADSDGQPGVSGPVVCGPGVCGPDSSGQSLGGSGSGGPGPGGAGASGPSSRGGPRPGGTIHLTMPLSALTGLTEMPGEVAGYGPADASSCRDLAARLAQDSSTRWCLTLTGADGSAVGHACAGRRGPEAGQPLITWAAGLRGQLHMLETGTCSHARQSPGYAWPTALRHLIEIRQRTCAAPGCRRPATACDLDHTLAYDHGGRTCECNASPT